MKERFYKSKILMAIPLFIFVAIDGTFGIQSVLPLIIATMIVDLITRKYKFTKLELRIYVVFAVTTIISTIENLIISPTLLHTQSLIRIVYYLVILYFYFSITHINYTKKEIELVLIASVVAGTIVSLSLIFINRIWFVNLIGTRLDKNFTGSILALEAELAFICGLEASKTKSRILYYLSCVIMVIGVYFTACRSSALAVLLGLFLIMVSKVLSMSKSRRDFIRAVILMISIPVILYIGVRVLISQMSHASATIQWYWNRYFINGYGDESVVGRVVWWEDAFRLWSERPLFGYGIGNINVSGNSSAVSHNTYLDFLLDQGLVGFCVFIYIIIRSIKPIFKKRLFLYYGPIITVILSCLILSATRSTFLWFSLMLFYIVGNAVENHEGVVR